MKKIINILTIFGLSLSSFGAGKIKHDDAVIIVPYEKQSFLPDPEYKEEAYDYQKQLDIYGGKKANREPFYFNLFGRRMYENGPYLGEAPTWFGKKNPMHPRLSAYGDLRIASAFVDDGGDDPFGEANTRLNLDVDAAITSTERIHAFFRPFDRGDTFTGFQFADDEDEGSIAVFDMNADALFFEGELGPILAGLTGEYNNLELPFAFGLMPMLFHNGIFVFDNFVGAGFAIPAMNSPTFDITNMDWSFFYGYDKINSVVINGDNNDDDAKIFGTNLFIEALEGYFEIGYGFTLDESENNQDFHSTMFSFTHRWQNIANYSFRVLSSFGQSDKPGIDDSKTADGHLFLLETSWHTKLPYTLVPYANFWLGYDKPQALAHQGSIIQNTGLVFEADGITNFQTIENSANNTYGASLGIQYLFALDRQIVFEMTTLQVLGGENELNINRRKALSPEYAAAFRFQQPLSQELIFRADGVYSVRDDQENIASARAEIRLKF